jgi:hypothetical protein
MPNGKALRDTSIEDPRQWLKRIQAERAMLEAMLEAMVERDITDEQDQHFHATADRLGDLIAAINIICAEV